jgi:hypothetical protein
MKSILPTIPWAADLPFGVFTSRSQKSAEPALPGNEKRIFRFIYGKDLTTEESDAPVSPSEETPVNSNSKRLFCSRFIKVSRQ